MISIYVSNSFQGLTCLSKVLDSPEEYEPSFCKRKMFFVCLFVTRLIRVEAKQWGSGVFLLRHLCQF